MKRFFGYAGLLVALLLSITSCEQDRRQASSGDFTILSGISNRQLLLGGAEGAQKEFHIEALHDWSILPTNGFSCSPCEGAASSNIAITATALQANNSADTVLLGDLTFKLLSTRFVGISAYQLPQVSVLESSRRVYAKASAGSRGTVTFISSSENVEVEVDEGIRLLAINNLSNGKYMIEVEITTDNTQAKPIHIGNVSFYINGVKQGAVAEIWQEAALQIDRTTLLLSGHAGAKSSFSVNSQHDFDISYSSTLFSATKTSSHTVEVAALANNTTSEQLSLGTIRITLTDVPGCYTDLEVKQHVANTPQTIIFYFMGRSLADYFERNITGALRALSGDIQNNSRILCYIQNTTTDASFYELRYDAECGEAVREKIGDCSVPTVYEEGMMRKQLKRLIEFAPAERYSLVLGSHGKGWIPKEQTRLRMGLGYDTLWKQVEGALPTRHVGDSAATQYDTTELAAELAGTGVKFEYILLDNCFMSNIEALYDLRHNADWFIASPTEVMASGFPYEKVLPLLLTNNGSSYDLPAVCKTYVDYYMQNSGSSQSACVALIEAAQLESLAAATKAVNAAALRSDFSIDNVQTYHGIHSSHMPVHIFYDVEDYVRQSCSDAAAVDAFIAQMARTVTSRHHTPSYYSAYNGAMNPINYYSGVSTSASVEAYEEAWKQTEWYKATH